MSFDRSSKQFVITIKDNGDGISHSGFEEFFALGGSEKTIGNKGLGTKTFLKCERLEVTSQTDKHRYKAVVDKPWEKLQNGEVLSYSVVEKTLLDDGDGTVIKIYGYKVGHPSTKYFKFDDV